MIKLAFLAIVVSLLVPARALADIPRSKCSVSAAGATTTHRARDLAVGLFAPLLVLGAMAHRRRRRSTPR